MHRPSDPAIPLLDVHPRRALDGVLLEMRASKLAAELSKRAPSAKRAGKKIRFVAAGVRGWGGGQLEESGQNCQLLDK